MQARSGSIVGRWYSRLWSLLTVRAIMFQDYWCVLLVGFMQQGTTISVVACCTRLEQLRAVIKQNCPFLLMKGAYLLHDIAWSHSVNMTWQLPAALLVGNLKYPAYSCYLAPSNCLLYRIVLAATHFKVMMVWRHLWYGVCNCRTQTSIGRELKGWFCDTSAAVVVGTMLKSKVSVIK
jgi:hypothetical protein